MLRIVGLAILCCALNSLGKEPTNSTKEINTPSQTSKAQVVIIGTIHDKHYKNPKYSPDVLKRIILSLKPDAILNELPLSQVEPNGRPIFRDPNKHPEGWAADAVATELGIKQIPFDRPDREKFRQKSHYYQRKRLSGQQRDECLEWIKKDNPQAIELKISTLQHDAWQAQEYIRLNARPEFINSDGFDSIVRVKDSIWEEILPVFLDKKPRCKKGMKNYHFLVNEWQERNRIMANNIIKAAKEHPGKRLVVVTGATHRYILRDLLKDEKSIELKEYWEVKGSTTGNAENTEEKQKQ